MAPRFSLTETVAHGLRGQIISNCAGRNVALQGYDHNRPCVSTADEEDGWMDDGRMGGSAVDVHWIGTGGKRRVGRKGRR